MKFLTGAVISAVLLAAAPAYADRGDGYGHGRGHDRHHWKHAHKYKHHGYKHHGYYHHPPHRVVRREVHHYYQSYRPAPVYYAPSAPVGISVVLPSIFIPFD